jgi:rhodanese-related sulfurtransferase
MMKAWRIRVLAVCIGLGAAVWLAGGLAWAQEFDPITPEALKKMIDSGDPSVVIVDVQPKSVYDLGHIKGAVNFPWAQALKSSGDLPMDKTLVLYCDCGAEGGDSLDTALQLKDRWGYSKIKLLEGGWSKWQQLGYPVEKK